MIARFYAWCDRHPLLTAALGIACVLTIFWLDVPSDHYSR